MKKIKLVEEFKAFISKGNVVDMAVGVVVGGAFGKIVTSLAVSYTHLDGSCFGTEGCGIINYLVVYVLSLEIRLVHCLHFSSKLIDVYKRQC